MAVALRVGGPEFDYRPRLLNVFVNVKVLFFKQKSCCSSISPVNSKIFKYTKVIKRYTEIYWYKISTDDPLNTIIKAEEKHR